MLKNIKRKYIALVHGVIDNNKGKIVAPIGRSKQDRKKMCVTDENAKNATTKLYSYLVITSKPALTTLLHQKLYFKDLMTLKYPTRP